MFTLQAKQLVHTTTPILISPPYKETSQPWGWCRNNVHHSGKKPRDHTTAPLFSCQKTSQGVVDSSVLHSGKKPHDNTTALPPPVLLPGSYEQCPLLGVKQTMHIITPILTSPPCSRPAMVMWTMMSTTMGRNPIDTSCITMSWLHKIHLWEVSTCTQACAHTHTHTQCSEWTLFSRTEDTAKQKVT